MLRMGPSGSVSGGEKSPGLGAAFGEELEKLPRQESIEEEDERLEEKTLSSEKTETPQRQENSAGNDTEPEDDAPASGAEVKNDESNVNHAEGLGITTEEIVENSTSETEKSDEPKEGDLASSLDTLTEANVENTDVKPDDAKENVDSAAVEAAIEPELIYRESDRMHRRTHMHTSESKPGQSSVAKSTLPPVWPWELLHSSTANRSLDFARSYDHESVLVGRHIHDIYGMCGSLLTAWIPAWAPTVFMFLLGMTMAYVALMPQKQANCYW
jgi:hypothetical protein